MKLGLLRAAVSTSLAIVATCWPTLDYAQQQDDRLGVGPATGYLAYRVDAAEKGLAICFPNYVAESKTVSNICVGAKLFEQVLKSFSSLKHFQYHGMDLSIDKTRLSHCWIPAYKDESGAQDNSSEGSSFQELTLECPYPDPSDGKYGLVISYNNSKYIPLKVFDYLCESAGVQEGSAFDRSIRSQFGAPLAFTEGGCYTGTGACRPVHGGDMTRYVWQNTASTVLLQISRDDNVVGPDASLDCSGPGHRAWRLEIDLNSDIGQFWSQYKKDSTGN